MSSEKRSYQLRARAERQRETRERIVAAVAELHQEVGPARTTVSEIARRAGVQRLTVYNHFPEEGEMFAACQAHYLASHPGPDFTEALGLPDPRDRAAAALAALYAVFRDREPMLDKILRDRSGLPELDVLLEGSVDAPAAHLAEALAGGFPAGSSENRSRIDAVLALAVDFRTWQRLVGRGFDDTGAAALMADLVACAAA